MNDNNNTSWFDLYNKEGIEVGTLFITIDAAEGHFVDITYELFGVDKKIIQSEKMTEMLPKSIADNIIRMTNFGEH